MDGYSKPLVTTTNVNKDISPQLMSPRELNALFNKIHLCYHHHGIWLNKDVAIGILHPGLLFQIHNNAQSLTISTPKGEFGLPLNNRDTVVASLMAVGAIIPGTATEVETIHHLLVNSIYSRSISYSLCFADCCNQLLKAIESINNIQMAFIGFGGIANHCLFNLAGSGFKHFILCDHDHVESTNLNRQLLFTQTDVGESKVQVGKREILRRFPDCDITCYTNELNSCSRMDYLSHTDYILITADEPPGLVHNLLKQLVSSHCKACIILAGYSCNSAIIHELDQQLPSPSFPWLRLTNSIMPSHGPINAELGAKVAEAVYQRVCHFSSSKPLRFAQPLNHFSIGFS
ncbi:ThiF family adenylyltransferase [Zooshikella harenae]|uniref:ThiF family adenylyltransferase n=1 Tax=Zooshikella harenae TaxID=2827238 RepID=A0ABS5ZBK6_9GAMM|nr:ThiF family adenylyltransferase [Zooshikella harenae]MBU2711437.1 ThiF family adenylyltransferase [Zooshikella harenae]